jgi:hypothetical protein
MPAIKTPSANMPSGKNSEKPLLPTEQLKHGAPKAREAKQRRTGEHVTTRELATGTSRIMRPAPVKIRGAITAFLKAFWASS